MNRYAYSEPAAPQGWEILPQRYIKYWSQEIRIRWLNKVNYVKKFLLPKQTVDTYKLCKRYKDLHGLPLKSWT